ncbi:MAG: hypothetical protein LUG16_00230 [Candidatus Gastranaerophilales bacterium]|nr:hypothetical protein [Candidatus Gastranaerophilales bacterium]
MEIFIAKKQSDKTLHQTGRYIIEYAAKEVYKIPDNELIIINKKPEFKYSNIHFSISHSKDIAGVCFDLNPVGFDIEKVLNIDFERIAARMKFQLQENSLNEFYKHWTLYEAEYKLQKKSLSAYTTEIYIDEEKYIMSVASTNKITESEISVQILE